MNTVKYLPIIVLTLLATNLPIATAQQQQKEEEYQIEEKWYGLPEARLFQEEYDGPPVVGDHLTRLPDVAPLPEGNNIHDVRIDVLVEEIEVGPGIRFKAWTF